MNVKKYFKKAQKGKWAIGQFNVSNSETLEAVVRAAEQLKSPIIIGTSENESRFIGLGRIAALVREWRKETGLPIFLNLDHAKSLEYIKEAVCHGYDSVHFDGSELEFEKNVNITRQAAKFCHRKNVFLEGEVGIIKGSSVILKEALVVSEEDMTNPEQAAKFLKKSKADSLAVSIGSSHGMKISDSDYLNLQRLKEIKEKTGKAFLVLHGGSGVDPHDIKNAIQSGIVKININTELRLAFTSALRKELQNKPEEIVPYKYMPEVIQSVKKVVEEKLKLINSVNKI